jgi:quinol monooxygenase YgiN
MIIIAGKIKIKPEMRAEAVAALLKMSTASEQEEGCRTYRFYADLEDPNTFLLYEEWDDAEALKPHGQSAHMAEFRQVMPTLTAAPSEIKRYEATVLKA